MELKFWEIESFLEVESVSDTGTQKCFEHWNSKVFQTLELKSVSDTGT